MPLLTPSWDIVKFFMLVVAVEHFLLLFKIIIELAIADVPKEVIDGKRDIAVLTENFCEGKTSNLSSHSCNRAKATDQARDRVIRSRDDPSYGNIHDTLI